MMKWPRDFTDLKPSEGTVDLAEKLVQEVAEQIRVLRTRDGVMVSNHQCQERARNIVAGLILNYEVADLDGEDRS